MGRRPQTSDQRTLTLRNHATIRCSQRYGVHLSDELHDGLVKSIERGTALLRGRRSIRVATYTVWLDGSAYHVAYDHQRRALVTFLPKDKWDTVEPPTLNRPRVRTSIDERLAIAAQHTADEFGCCSCCDGFVAYPCPIVQRAERLARQEGLIVSTTD